MRGLLRIAFASLAFACGGPGPTAPHPPPIDAGVEAAAPAHLDSTLPTNVRTPPPFHLESKHVRVRERPEWAECAVAFQPRGDPAKAVGALGAECSAATHMHAAGAPMTGSQNAATSQPVSYPFHAQAKHCYRVYGVAGNGVKSLVAVLSDETGASVAEYHTDDISPFFAPNQALCFVDDTDMKVTASVGIGDGPYALQLWSD